MTNPLHPDDRDDDSTSVLAAIQHLPMEDLALFCAHEIQVYLAGGSPNERYVLEVCRRAVALHDSAALGCLYRNFAPFALSYLMRHPQAEPLFEQKEPAALVDAALATFTINLTGEKLARLNSLALILRYLMVSVHTTVAERLRARQLDERLAPLAAKSAPERLAAPHPGEATTGAQELWQVMEEELPEAEAILFTLLFVRGYTALDVCLQEPEGFPDAEAVYRAQMRIFTRLRSSERLQALLRSLLDGTSPSP